MPFKVGQIVWICHRGEFEIVEEYGLAHGATSRIDERGSLEVSLLQLLHDLKEHFIR